MFTGIVQKMCLVVDIDLSPGLLRYAILMDDPLIKGLQRGASVSIDGICHTVTTIDGHKVWFDAIDETLQRTTIKFLKRNQLVNVERSARLGDEIGGHILSGHIYGTASIIKIDQPSNNHIITFQCPPPWTKYLFPKGYVALDGVSLTLVDVNPQGFFSVHLIPETLQQTTFGHKKENSLVNLELDTQTQTIVDTIDRYYARISTN